MKSVPIRIVQVTNPKLICKWYKKFAKTYFGHDQVVNTKFKRMIADQKSWKFLFAFQGLIPLGFVRISRRSDLGTNAMWCIQDAYVREGYRSRGILKVLLEKCLSDNNCGYILLSYDRVINHQFYYASLGLIHQIQHPKNKNYRYLATQNFMDFFKSDLSVAA